MEPDSPEAIPPQGELIHRNFVKLMLIGDFENQLALFRAALPGVVVPVVMAAAIVVAITISGGWRAGYPSP